MARQSSAGSGRRGPVLRAAEPVFERVLALYGLWGLNVLVAGMLVALRLMAPKPRPRSTP